MEREADHSPPSSAGMMDMCSFSSTTSHVFILRDQSCKNILMNEVFVNTDKRKPDLHVEAE
jgi:hypothetical protein